MQTHDPQSSSSPAPGRGERLAMRLVLGLFAAGGLALLAMALFGAVSCFLGHACNW